MEAMHGQPNSTTTIAISVAQAEKYLAAHERHYVAPVEKICAIGLATVVDSGDEKETDFRDDQGDYYRLCGAAILGRRPNGDAELGHIYVDGTFQGYSILYGACWRALKALGYKRAWL